MRRLRTIPVIILRPTAAANLSGAALGYDPIPGLGQDRRAIIDDVSLLRRLFAAGHHPSASSSAHALSAEADALVRAATGDQRAFAQFYDLVSPMVFGLIVKIVRSRAISEEVTQEVFVELWRNAPAFDPERGSVGAWAATVARRRAIDRVRSEESARRRDDNEAKTVRVPADTVSERVEVDLERDGVAAALAQLGERQRQAITLAFYGGHSYREVAELLGAPEGTVKSRIRDGLRRLRDILEVTT